MPRSFKNAPDRVRIIALVGEELLDPGDQADAFLSHHAIGGVAWRQDERPRPAGRVDDRVDLAVSAALRKPDRLKIRPPFSAVGTAVYFHMAAI